jgi:hypothetical protein
LKKLISIFAVGILILTGLGAVSVANDKTFDLKTEKKQLVFSEPIIKDEGQYVTINLKEETTSLLDAQKPSLPVVTQVFTFPFKTKINQVEVIYTEPKNLVLPKEVKPAPEPIILDTELQTTNQIEKNIETYESEELYPSNTFSYTVGAGLANNEHVIYLSVRCYPVRYSPAKNTIYYSESAEIIISYEEPKNPVSFPDEYDLLIISPAEFSNELQPLINHKNSYGINTTLKTTEAIYSEYTGYDEAEQIKYFIKDALDNYGIEYVLLIGGVEKLPIRTTWFFQRQHEHYWNETVLTDLYYADIYDKNSNFCSWDSNGNHLYGEIYNNVPGINDTVDLYADVNIGRIPCVKNDELKVVVNKIIHYETYTSGESWFNNIILIGGDTFPGWNGNEGEEKNAVTEQIMSDFTPTTLWTSDNTFSARAFNKALNKGAGFVDYSGHGFEIGASTHPPDSNKWIGYYFYNLFWASNGYKLPIIYFDACLTANLDFNLSGFINYIRPLNSNPNPDSQTSIFNDILKPWKSLSIFEKLVPCFGWNFVKKKSGGAIATIGATRTAYGDLTYGCGYLSLQFYRAYSTSQTLSQMLTKAQNVYLNNIWRDYFTVEEFIIIGDPSLKLGGY